MLNSISGEVGSPVTIEDSISSAMFEQELSLEDVVFTSIGMLTRRSTPAARIMQYCIDIAGDQYISEEFYQNYPELLKYLDMAGCDNEEVLFRAFVLSHPDIFNCKQLGCHGKIIGGCPKMYCDDCGKLYFLEIEGITDLFCSRCVAREMQECTEKSRRRRYQIHVPNKKIN